MKNNNPSVDVIIPTYNGLPYLEATIQSVLNQRHSNLQLYVIDDGSSDDTEKFVKELKDPRIHYKRKPNGGQSTARNLGIKISKSPYIAFIDSDDLWYPTKLEKQLEIFNANQNVGLVYGHHYIIDEEDIIQGNLRIWKRGHIFNELCGGNFIAGSASMVLIKREVFDAVGLFKEDFLIGEDWEMWLRIAKAYEIDFVPEIIASLRQRSDGMQQNHVKMSDGLIYMLDVMKKELDLTPVQAKVMTAYCLFNAAIGYNAARKRGQARKTLFKLFAQNPKQLAQIDHWKVHIGFGLYTRVVLGNPVFDFIHYLYRQVKRLIGRFLRLLFRAARSIKHKIK